MIVTGSLHAIVLAMIWASSCMCCAGFNVDVDSAVIHYLKEGKTNFGYRAEFLKKKQKEKNAPVSLVVSVPQWNVTRSQASGAYYLCEPLKKDSCKKLSTSPKWPTDFEDFGEKHEMFGLTMSVVNDYTALVCGPLWRDMAESRKYDSNYYTVGRCQLIPPGNATLSPLLNTKYIGKTRVNKTDIEGYLTGLALFGFSASCDKKGQIVIGTPGYGQGKGSFGVLTLPDEKIDLMESDIGGQEGGSFLGFAVVEGDFCGGEQVCFAVSNRRSNGQVYVVARVMPKDFREIQQLNDSQVYSSFGFSLCAIDINGDGLCDLLVGAPTYSSHAKQPPSYDEGRVFVYLQVQGKLLKNVSWAGSQKGFARFGSALGDIGDINADSRNDVAVGAPQEDEGRGAVYIYLGSSKGPDTVYSQRISGLEVDNGLFSFGSHISQPTSDLTPYNYPVGSPESDAVVVLRTSLIINARVNIVTPPGPIHISNSDCPANISTGSVKASGCIKLEVCLNYSAKNGGRLFNNLSFQLSVRIDTLVDDASRRVRLYRGRDKTVTSLTDTVSVGIRDTSCNEYTGLLIEEKIVKNIFAPMKVEANFTLNTTSLAGSLKPILNTSHQARKSAKMTFLSSCGKPDLSLEGSVLHEPSKGHPRLNVVNMTREVVLYLNVASKAETVYGLTVLVNIDGQIVFRTATDDEGASWIFCKKGEGEDKNEELEQTGSSLVCISGLTLHQGQAISIRLLFDAASVPLQGSNPVTTFNATALPCGSDLNPDVNKADNTVIFESRKAIVANISIEGLSDPRSLFVYNSENKALEASHKLLVTNKGPSFMPATDIDIKCPCMGQDSMEPLASQKVTIKHAREPEMECPYMGIFADGVAAATVSSSEGPATQVLTGDSITFPEIPANRRRRRHADDEKQTVDTESSGKNSSDSTRDFRMDCQNYRCKMFRCRLAALQPDTNAEIIISVVINSSFLPFSEKVVNVAYVTTSEVKEPDTPFFHKWTKLRSAVVQTPIYRVNLSREVSIWIIVGGVIGGILALTAIAFILHKAGFFRRTDRDRLQRLKRASGFYRMERTRHHE